MNSFGGLGSAVNMCVKIGSSNVLIMRIFPFNDRLRLFQVAMIVFILANLFSKFSVTDWASTLEKVMPSTFSLFVHLIFNSEQIGSLVSASLPAQNACVFSMFGFKPEYLANVWGILGRGFGESVHQCLKITTSLGVGVENLGPKRQ